MTHELGEFAEKLEGSGHGAGANLLRAAAKSWEKEGLIPPRLPEKNGPRTFLMPSGKGMLLDTLNLVSIKFLSLVKESIESLFRGLGRNQSHLKVDLIYPASSRQELTLQNRQSLCALDIF